MTLPITEARLMPRTDGIHLSDECGVVPAGHEYNGVTGPAPLKQMDGHLPDDAAARKNLPIGTVIREYFPKAFAYLALVSKRGNDQHNPGQPLHWAREKSTDHIDCIARHHIDVGKKDGKGMRHSGGLLWRAAANLQLELEEAERNGEEWWKDGEPRS